MLVEIYILDAQAQTFHEPEARAVEELSHEQVRVGEALKNHGDFIFGEDGGKALGLLGLSGAKLGSNGLMENVVVEKENGAAGLILGGSGHVPLHGQPGKEGFNFRDAHILGMDVLAGAFLMEDDETLDPLHVGLLGAVGVVSAPDGIPHLIQKFGPGGNLSI